MSALKAGEKNAYHYIWHLDKLWCFQQKGEREREREWREEKKREEDKKWVERELRWKNAFMSVGGDGAVV